VTPATDTETERGDVTMSASHETGVLRDRLPFVRIGAGATPLVVLPGLSLTNELPGGVAAAAWARGFRRLAREHTLFVVQRPSPLAPGTSTQDIAAEYASVLGPELGRFRLMGLSTGGLIAQHLALDDPSSVERLALVVSGSRLADRGRELCTRWLALAGAGRWRELGGDLAAVAVDGRAVQGITRALFRLAGTAPDARQAADFATTVAADLAHDARSRLGALPAPTLVLGGALDPFFPEEILRETAAAVPDAELRVFPRNGHGVPKHRARAMQTAVAEFLTRSDHGGRARTAGR
jgi:pimeloyl-ACP methyl ester carboxylesterase